MKILVDGVELAVTQAGNGVFTSVTARRVVGRDRKRKLDITSAITSSLDGDPVLTVVRVLKDVAAMPTARCTCNYHYGYSDHAEHCQSIHVAREYIDHDD